MPGKVLVLGGKGTTGSIVARTLTAMGIDHRIATRSPAGGNDVAFDWSDVKLARSAFSEVDAVYIVAPTDRSDHGDVVPPILEQALAHGVRRFVLLSASSLEKDGPMMGQIHGWLERHTDDWCVLRPSWFMQNFSSGRHLDSIRDHDAIYSATGDGKVGFIDANDIAASAVAALTTDAPFNRDVVLTGPGALSYAEIAALLSSALGRQIKHVQVAKDELEGRLRQTGMDNQYASILAAMDAQIADVSESRITDRVRDLTGQTARSFEAYVRSNAAAWVKETN